MLNAIKFLVDSSQHVFPEVFYKTIVYIIVKKGEILDLFQGKPTCVIKKVANKKLHIIHYYGYFYFSHFC